MKCFVVDTKIGIFAFDETGTILNYLNFYNTEQKVIEFYESLDRNLLLNDLDNFVEELKSSGFNEFIFDNNKLETLISEKFNLKTQFHKQSLEFKSFRFNLVDRLNKIGITYSKENLLNKFKIVNEQLIRKKVSEVGGKFDSIVIQVIETLEIIKKSLNLFSSRLREWYGLHFPELTDKLVEDSIQLAKMVLLLGNRNNYNSSMIKQQFDFKESLVNELVKKALESMGATINLDPLQNYAKQILSLDKYREELEVYLEDLMEKLAPNLKSIVGSLIGAKLISKAGGLKELAYMPASRVQILGAEKALYKFLKTGEKRPKHGLIFQWQQIRSSKPWIRGKISRLIAGKLGLASKVDYFSGDFIGDVFSKEIEEKIKEIEIKYPKPPKRLEQKVFVRSKRYPPKNKKKKGKTKK
ncbi:MAG TPA: C/D box methylation guide ribonucleoprotein complex aNOP56 subunit [Candidatus Lokiarchaeia archaeon]